MQMGRLACCCGGISSCLGGGISSPTCGARGASDSGHRMASCCSRLKQCVLVCRKYNCLAGVADASLGGSLLLLRNHNVLRRLSPRHDARRPDHQGAGHAEKLLVGHSLLPRWPQPVAPRVGVASALVRRMPRQAERTTNTVARMRWRPSNGPGASAAQLQYCVI